ncbi:MAG: hypothetical protein KJ058_00460 [Thermoanaerobaculia bacterium]|nr:hypothetical protein [Thermoanaerobaculia bacterium]
MATQTVGNVHVDVPLTNLARLYRPLEAGFIADEVCPRLPVQKESDLYYVFDKGPWFGAGDDIDLDLVADRAAAKRVEFAHSTEKYFCEERALAFDVSDRERRNADSQLRLEENKQRGTLLRLALLRERRVARLLQDTSQTGGELDAAMDAASAARWDAAATTYANIRGDIITAKQRVRDRIGINPNVIVIPLKAAEGLTATAFYGDVVRWNVQSGERPNLTRFTDDVLLPDRLFGLRVIVAGAIRDTAAEGGSFSSEEVWGEVARVAYVTAGPAMEIPSVAYTFQASQPMTRRWREDPAKVDVFEASNGVIDEKVVATEACATITNLLT